MCWFYIYLFFTFAEGMVYWSPEPVISADVLYQNQRPFILPRLPGKYDAVAVEATAYALLVYIRYNGFLQDRIVRWLNTMRTTDCAFISSQVPLTRNIMNGLLLLYDAVLLYFFDKK